MGRFYVHMAHILYGAGAGNQQGFGRRRSIRDSSGRHKLRRAVSVRTAASSAPGLCALLSRVLEHALGSDRGSAFHPHHVSESLFRRSPIHYRTIFSWPCVHSFDHFHRLQVRVENSVAQYAQSDRNVFGFHDGGSLRG